jgi:RNA polymerase sigma factor (TIGR02999 family)
VVARTAIHPKINHSPNANFSSERRTMTDERMDVTTILAAIEAGDPHAAEALLPLVYDELRRLARARLAAEPPGRTIQATELVHEAYLRLVGADEQSLWTSRGHFFGAAARAMRRILIDRARMRHAAKRGRDQERINFHSDLVVSLNRDDKLILLDSALERLECDDPLKAKLVELRFFAGLTNQEAAEQLGISTATATRHWAYARAWLKREMS